MTLLSSQSQLQTELQPVVTEEDLIQAVRTLLSGLGKNPNREGLKDTPKRVVKALKFLTSGYQPTLDKLLNGGIFPEDTSKMVLVRDIFSLSSDEYV